MKIALIHNFYQLPGGEDVGFRNDKELFLSRGHEVVEFTKHNDEIKGYSAPGKLALAFTTTYNSKIKKEFASFLRINKPAVAHFHNTFPLISPAAYDACKEAGIPVVHTLHNYRLFCANAVCYRNGNVCEDCFSKFFPWPAIAHACYQNSRLRTAAVVGMQSVHRYLDTWKNKVDAYIVLNNSMRDRLVSYGLPAGKIAVWPNFVNNDHVLRQGEGEYALFLGRLSGEKGPFTLPQAWRRIKDFPLKIAGDGPEREKIQAFIAKHRLENIEMLGHVAKDKVFPLISGAKFLIFTSVCYETFPRAVIESFACGVPVIASRLGAVRNIVEDGKTGLCFSPGDPLDLAEKVKWALAHKDRMHLMGEAARKEYEVKYSADKYYRKILDIYQGLTGSAKERRA